MSQFRETIVKELKRRGWSAYRLGKESGVGIRNAQRYVSGTGDLAGERVEALARVLGLELRPIKQGKARG